MLASGTGLGQLPSLLPARGVTVQLHCDPGWQCLTSRSLTVALLAFTAPPETLSPWRWLPPQGCPGLALDPLVTRVSDLVSSSAPVCQALPSFWESSLQGEAPHPKATSTAVTCTDTPPPPNPPSLLHCLQPRCGLQWSDRPKCAGRQPVLSLASPITQPQSWEVLSCSGLRGARPGSEGSSPPSWPQYLVVNQVPLGLFLCWWLTP